MKKESISTLELITQRIISWSALFSFCDEFFPLLPSMPQIYQKAITPEKALYLIPGNPKLCIRCVFMVK